LVSRPCAGVAVVIKSGVLNYIAGDYGPGMRGLQAGLNDFLRKISIFRRSHSQACSAVGVWFDQFFIAIVVQRC